MNSHFFTAAAKLTVTLESWELRFLSVSICAQLSMLPVLEPPFLLLDHTPDNPVTNTGNESGVSFLEGVCRLLGEQEPVTLARPIAGGQYIMELEGYPL